MLDLLLILTMLVFAVQAIRARRLIPAALWLAGISALLAIFFYRLGAPYVAAIELSVGAGLVTVLFVFAISVAGEEIAVARPHVPQPLAWGLALVSIILLGWLAWPLVGWGGGVIERPLPELLWQQRGMDMLVQLVLIFAGVLGLLGLLAETKAPLDQAVAAEVAARRDRELLEMQHKAMP
ncbi:MAG: NADH-quinone oxidoreductase subunit J [Ardenticatenaceae bacterium]|nr:NADH-quinone oxidoreductase subunit J [Ardenticatenaceae bacterium]MCB9444169.1 NADH-quinone oxidoreductase subunit J [Ardenticatenaceae bacterium]